MKNDTFLDHAQSVVIEHIQQQTPINVKVLADRLHMHPVQLYRKVKKAKNISPSIFIQQIRLEQAKGLLQNTSCSVSEISFQVGFESHSYFSACFKDYFGIKPSRYREKM